MRAKTAACRTQSLLSLPATSQRSREHAESDRKREEPLSIAVPAAAAAPVGVTCSLSNAAHLTLSKQLSNPERQPLKSVGALAPLPPGTGPGSAADACSACASACASTSLGMSPSVAWPWLDHQRVSRNLSAPDARLMLAGGGESRRRRLGEIAERKGRDSVSDSQLHLMRAAAAAAAADADAQLCDSWRRSTLFVPSSAVWGAAPFSVSPVLPSSLAFRTASATTAPSSADTTELRLKLYYHLSNLFPEPIVSAVMGAYPDEIDPQVLCSLILALQKNMASLN